LTNYFANTVKKLPNSVRIVGTFFSIKRFTGRPVHQEMEVHVGL